MDTANVYEQKDLSKSLIGLTMPRWYHDSCTLFAP